MSKIYMQSNSMTGFTGVVFGGGGGRRRKKRTKKTTEIKSKATSRQYRDYENAMRSAGWNYVKDYSQEELKVTGDKKTPALFAGVVASSWGPTGAIRAAGAMISIAASKD